MQRDPLLDVVAWRAPKQRPRRGMQRPSTLLLRGTMSQGRRSRQIPARTRRQVLIRQRLACRQQRGTRTRRLRLRERGWLSELLGADPRRPAPMLGRPSARPPVVGLSTEAVVCAGVRRVAGFERLCQCARGTCSSKVITSAGDQQTSARAAAGPIRSRRQASDTYR